MIHLIIVKFKESIDWKAFVKPIEQLFQQTLEIPEVEKVEVIVSNSNLPNRYDLMIQMTLSKEALISYDQSEPHKQWKAEYGPYIEKKTIFDYDK